MKNDIYKLLREDCHNLLDELAKNRKQKNATYSWLAKRLKIPPQICHFGKMNLPQLYSARRLLKQKIRNRKKRGLL